MTRASLVFLLPLLIFSRFSQTQAQAAVKTSKLAKTFQINSRRVNQGVHVVRASDGQVLFSQNSQQLFSPASLSKLVTSAALLHYFGANHRFHTNFYFTGSFQKGIITGDLIIEPDGDPTLISETLWQFSRDLKHIGLKSIKGNILVKENLFSGDIRDELRLEGLQSSNHAYDAPITAFGINFNTIAIAISPGSAAGSIARANLDPFPIANISIENKLRTSKAGRKPYIRATRVSLPQGKAKIVLSGRIPLDSSLIKIYRSVNDPFITSGEIIKSFLHDANISTKGKIQKISAVPGDSMKLITIESEPMSAIIKKLNIHSNNFIADVMIKRLGVANYSQDGHLPNPEKAGGTYKQGMNAINQFLKTQVGIRSKYHLENGSGLTIQNRLSAQQITQILLYMSKHWEVFPDFLASLPTAGETGTLEKRFKSLRTSPLRGQIRAKTGTLSDPYTVSSLAGFIHHKNHGLIAFSIIHNGKPGKKQPRILDLQEKQELDLLGLARYL